MDVLRELTHRWREARRDLLSGDPEVRRAAIDRFDAGLWDAYTKATGDKASSLDVRPTSPGA